MPKHKSKRSLRHRGKDMGGVHPNSLAARARKDPALKERIAEGRKRFNEDRAAMEWWANGGFRSNGSGLEYAEGFEDPVVKPPAKDGGK